MSTHEELTHRLLELFEPVELQPRALLLEPEREQAWTPEQLRSVWGMQLHELNLEAYEALMGEEQGPPRYLLRADSCHQCDPPALDFILLGPAVRWQHWAMCAWELAGQAGFGAQRVRFAFAICGRTPDGTLLADAVVSWSLAEACEEAGVWARLPMYLSTPSMLRMLQNRQLVTTPTFTDLCVASMRRVRALLPEEHQAEGKQLQREVIEAAKTVACEPWKGEDTTFERYSASQGKRITLRGIQGGCRLPDGPGPLWPLLVAASWLQLGKGTSMGLGTLLISLDG